MGGSFSKSLLSRRGSSLFAGGMVAMLHQRNTIVFLKSMTCSWKQSFPSSLVTASGHEVDTEEATMVVRQVHLRHCLHFLVSSLFNLDNLLQMSRSSTFVYERRYVCRQWCSVSNGDTFLDTGWRRFRVLQAERFLHSRLSQQEARTTTSHALQ